jgi:hypothetical protein
MLAYAAQGVPTDQASRAGSQVRDFLDRALSAMTGIAEACETAIKQNGIDPVEYRAFLAVLERDANDSRAAIEMVVAQPAISSQLIDNLNASIHLRALLTDLFLVGEILRGQSRLKADVFE